MKFAHMADCHIGSWRDPRLHDVSTKAFAKAVDLCIEQQVDFVLIAGDLFNNALPPIDKLKTATKKLKELQEKNIPVYVILESQGKVSDRVAEMFMRQAFGKKKR